MINENVINALVSEKFVGTSAEVDRAINSCLQQMMCSDLKETYDSKIDFEFVKMNWNPNWGADSTHYESYEKHLEDLKELWEIKKKFEDGKVWKKLIHELGYSTYTNSIDGCISIYADDQETEIFIIEDKKDFIQFINQYTP